MTEARKRAFIVSSFTDAGTRKSYVAGTTRKIPAGAFANYEAAGLVLEKAPAASSVAAAITPPASGEGRPSA